MRWLREQIPAQQADGAPFQPGIFPSILLKALLEQVTGPTPALNPHNAMGRVSPAHRVARDQQISGLRVPPAGTPGAAPEQETEAKKN